VSDVEFKASLTELRDRGIFATRQLAKRQLTWLKSMPDLGVYDPLATDIAAAVLAAVGHHIGHR